MPMRVGEMMVIIRAEDFASRTLRRVSTEFGRMSRFQAQQARTAQQLGSVRAEMRSLGILERRNQLQQEFIDLQRKVTATQAQAVQGRGPGGAFQPLTQQARAARAALPALTAELSRAERSFLMSDMAVDGLTRKFRRLKNDIPEISSRMADLTTAERDLAMEHQRLGRLIPIERMQDWGHAISGISRTLQLVGAGTTIAFGMAAKSAAEFSTDISLAATQARDLDASAAQIPVRMDQLSNGFDKAGTHIEGVLDLMQRFPATQQEMSAAAYDVFSSMDLETNGIIDVAKGLGLLEKANQIAVASGVPLEEATSAMITTFNNFGSSVEEQSANLDTMFDIVRFGRMRMSDFNIMMNKIAPAAADAGMKLEDVGGAMAYLTTVMPSQRMVATGISRLIEALRHPDIVAGLKKFGIEAKTASGALKPLDALLVEIADRFPQLRTGQKSAAEFFRELSAIGRGGGRGQIFTAEGRRAMSQIMTHLDAYLDAQGRIEKNTGEFSQALEAQLKTIGVQWAIFTNQLRTLFITIGTEAVPVFQEIGGHIQRFVKWFRELDKETRAQIVRWTVWAGVIALAAGILGALAGAIMSLIAFLRLFAVTGGNAATRMAGLWAILRNLAGIGAIAIILKTMWGGDASAKDFLMGAIAGGLFGARFGPAGAIIGAATVTVILALQTDQATKEFNDWISVHGTRGQRWFKKFFGPFEALAPFRPSATAEQRREFDTEMRRRAKAIRDAEKSRGLHGEGMLAPRHRRKQLREEPEIVKNLRDELARLYKEMNNGNSVIDQQKEALKQWHQQMKLTAEQAAVDAMNTLRSMYSQMQQENEAAFGELFQGPWLTSETFDLAKEWGITPRIEDLITDLKQQNAQFAKWRNSLDMLMKRGLPREFINELRQMGPEEGQAILDQIIGATPAQTQRLIAEWKRKQAQIKEATKMDFTREINAFKKAGGDMGKAMIDGFQNAGVGLWFDNWIKATFPGLIDAAVKQSVEEWKKANPRPKIPVTAKPNVVNSGNTSTTHTDNSKTATVVINPHVSPDANDRAREAQARRMAFDAQTALMGWFG